MFVNQAGLLQTLLLIPLWIHISHAVAWLRAVTTLWFGVALVRERVVSDVWTSKGRARAVAR
jgi:hypothetical protein